MAGDSINACSANARVQETSVLEDVPVPGIAANEVLVKVTAAGMCRTDVQLLDRYFEKYALIPPPITLGHEIAGVVEKIGTMAPKTAGFEEGDEVVVVGVWGDGTCCLCQQGDTQISVHGKRPGFSAYGGYSEYVPVPFEYLVKVDKRFTSRRRNLLP